MISNRLRGLIHLHTVTVVLVSLLLLLGYQNTFRYVYPIDLNPGVNFMPFLLCVVLGMVFSVRFLRQMASHFHRLSWGDSIRLTTRQTVVVALFIFSFMFATKDQLMSRIFIGSYLLLLWVLLLVANVEVPKVLCRLFFPSRHRIPTLFVGSPRSLEKLKHWLASKEMLGLFPVGFVSEQDYACDVSELAPLGTLRELARIIADRAVVQVIVLDLPATAGESRHIVETCQAQGCRLLIYSNVAEELGHTLVTTTEEGHLFYTLQEEPLEDPLNRVLKRALDLAIAIPVGVLILPPLMICVWLMQRIQAPGRLFFTQERTGHGQHKFKILKFRSMYEASQGPASEARQVRPGDQRIYPFGRFMRSTSLDEFPQFINVIMGEMSVVGPRPHLVAHDHQFNSMMRGYRTRFFVKPGITGLAQCHGLRGEITEQQLLEKRIKFDVDYISRWSVWLDVQLVLRTFWQLLFPPKTAY